MLEVNGNDYELISAICPVCDKEIVPGASSKMTSSGPAHCACIHYAEQEQNDRELQKRFPHISFDLLRELEVYGELDTIDNEGCFAGIEDECGDLVVHKYDTIGELLDKTCKMLTNDPYDRLAFIIVDRQRLKFTRKVIIELG